MTTNNSAHSGNTKVSKPFGGRPQLVQGRFAMLKYFLMKGRRRWLLGFALVVFLSPALTAWRLSPPTLPPATHIQASYAQEEHTLLPAGFTEGTVTTNGIRMHYVRGGQGRPLVLLHGFPETWYSWHKVLPDLAKHYLVIAPDLRGAGQTDAPSSGYDKMTMAQDIRGLVTQLKLDSIDLVGHDIGLMVAFAYAELYPTSVQHLALLEAPIPDKSLYQYPALTANGPGVWWFGFFGVPQMPEKLIQGREKTFLEQFFQNTVPVQVQGSITAEEIALYARNWQDPARLHAYISYFSAFKTDTAQVDVYSQKKLLMPVLALGADHSIGTAIFTQVEQYATNVTGDVISNSGHWIPEEHPQELVSKLLAFLSK
ncbi:alpha/beta fold hydrolase [Tengunoibacter tsumagoiensis]|uniref:Dehalogenase n=1 Tax=Tengunoibacter tsumagoiensis TaxID=2014871 RepID=A0A402A898_9CHLR|nr:alpha/beta hydrolase [Tengunoibacter tsumagoiensis]GCE15191.1 dehalogenase [Tengunoibacter tsumagoiensis]